MVPQSDKCHFWSNLTSALHPDQRACPPLHPLSPAGQLHKREYYFYFNKTKNEEQKLAHKMLVDTSIQSKCRTNKLIFFMTHYWLLCLIPLCGMDQVKSLMHTDCWKAHWHLLPCQCHMWSSNFILQRDSLFLKSPNSCFWSKTFQDLFLDTRFYANLPLANLYFT